MSSFIPPPSPSYSTFPSPRVTEDSDEDKINPTIEIPGSDGSNAGDNDNTMGTTSPSRSPSFVQPITFSTVIENDHNTINRFAGRLTRAKTASDRAHLLREVTWRLVRHDVSEDLVMRPAFIAQLGEQGEHMAEHDRADHDRAKNELLALFADGPSAPHFATVLDRLFAELLEHMRLESGEQIPALERMLDLHESQRLGKEYIRTQSLTPELELADERGVKVRVWKDVEDYARTDLARFKEIYARMCEEQNRNGRPRPTNGKHHKL
ncbi:hypothetical protein PV08_05880 [Exophiala spinifera]|uniref:Hemerythrin-like domain-containing protein n=1 Tax=Exophiala spinifera TaxID=91928 RepID=A0A0D2BB38_9EURO|nr:uncharacterized protein PV08_05880 [Exophiala spinifera]KIW15830.1 hypothetical protein PV08_05880 [Exophiala spinifera]